MLKDSAMTGQGAAKRAEEVRMDAMRQAMAFCERVLGWRWREATPLHIQQSIDAAVAEAVKERDAEIAELTVALKGAAKFVADARDEARREERQWWLDACEDDFPCITAGRPRGTCPHESFISCVLDADTLRRPPASAPECGACADGIVRASNHSCELGAGAPEGEK